LDIRTARGVAAGLADLIRSLVPSRVAPVASAGVDARPRPAIPSIPAGWFAGSAQRGVLAVALISLVWLAAFAWPRPLMLPDEGRYVGIAWEMLRSGDWSTPTLDGLPFFHKPPLFYWITAASLTVFGLNDWAARAAPLLGAWIGAIALFLFLRRWWGERAARTALIALLVQPLFYLGGQFANLDMLVAGLITATIVLLAHAALSVERALPFRRALAGAYAAAAFGVLAKGLIGLVIPALVIGAWLVLLRRWRTLRALLWAPGALLALAIAPPWFIAMQLRFPEFADYFFVVQHVKRFAAGGFNNVQPFWFYPAVLLAGMLPWLAWLRAQFVGGRWSDPQHGEIRVLMGAWIAVVTLFFSLPESKLLGYILPAVPPLAVLAADGFLAQAAPSRRGALWWRLSAFAGCTVSAIVIVVASLHPAASAHDLALALRSQRGAGEPVYMLGNYYFDVPLYARLPGPVHVVDEWQSADVERRDNWRKELAEAARFAPDRAARLLVTPAQLADDLCASPVSWVVAPTSSTDRFPFLHAAPRVASERATSLWRVDRRHLCDGAGMRTFVHPAGPIAP
jgi:4-amino-4-deoxy-L-arabinose transferase-like glycosyltransferase